MLRCCKCINVVTVVVVYDIITFLAAIAALYVTMSVGRSVRNEFYSSVMPLVVYICCCSNCRLDY